MQWLMFIQTVKKDETIDDIETDDEQVLED